MQTSWPDNNGTRTLAIVCSTPCKILAQFETLFNWPTNTSADILTLEIAFSELIRRK